VCEKQRESKSVAAHVRHTYSRINNVYFSVNERAMNRFEKDFELNACVKSNSEECRATTCEAFVSASMSTHAQFHKDEQR
jgi:hypothetical protein